MPTIDFIDIGDVLNYEFLQGTLKSINTDDDTCTVEVSGVTYPAVCFYHCGATGTLRSNGAIEGAAMGFIKTYWDYYYKIPATEKVIVMKKRDNSIVKVIGYVDIIRRCFVVPAMPYPPTQE
ncbi:MAG: hypothetical protein WC554_08330 [Clostridia bacterium]|jgi:hypothetical protein